MRILWHSVPPVFCTGYGMQTRLFVNVMKERGRDVLISSIAGSYPTHINAGTQILSQGLRASMGNDFVDIHFRKHKCDVVISMMDTFVMDMKKFAELPWVGWQVVDSYPLVKQLHKPCATTKYNLAMAEFGKATMKDAGYDSALVPLCYSAAEMYPVEKEEARRWIRESWGEDWGKKFVVMMNSANMSKPSRKNFSAALRAFAEFKKEVPDSLLYIHTEFTGQLTGGEDLRDMAMMYGLSDADVRFPPQYEYNMGLLGTDFLRYCYNAADCFLMSSRGEGFGIPLIEAQACGTPVIAVPYSAMQELVFKGELMPEENITKWAYVETSEQAIIDPVAIVNALRTMEATERTKDIPEEVKEYEVNNIYDVYFNPFLEWLEQNPQILKGEKNNESNSTAASSN